MKGIYALLNAAKENEAHPIPSDELLQKLTDDDFSALADEVLAEVTRRAALELRDAPVPTHAPEDCHHFFQCVHCGSLPDDRKEAPQVLAPQVFRCSRCSDKGIVCRGCEQYPCACPDYHAGTFTLVCPDCIATETKE